MFTLKYAFKSITRRPKKNFGTIIAISLGVMLLIGVQVGSLGLEKALANSWYGSVGNVDMTVESVSSPYFPSNVSADLQSNVDYKNLISISERFDQLLPLYSYKDGQLIRDVVSMGIVPSDPGFGEFYDLDGNIVDPTILNNDDSIIINDLLANELGLQIGDVVLSSMNNGNGTSVSMQFEVVEIIDHNKGRGKENVFDGNPIMYGDIDEFRSNLIEPLQDHVTSLVFSFSGVDKSLEALDTREQSFPGKSIIEDNVEVTEEYIQENSYGLFAYSDRVNLANSIAEDVSSIKETLNLFVILLNMVALLLIVNIQSMGLDDRRYQTAVLRAMGSSKRRIFTVFLVESSIVGILGAILGSIGGVFMGKFIEDQITSIFGFTTSSGYAFEFSMIPMAVLMGILLAVITAVVPAWFAASRSVTNELRGIDEEKVEKSGRKRFVFGFTFLLVGLLSAQNVGKFWTKEAWHSFDNQVSILLSFGLSLAGIGLLLSYIINEKIALNISALSLYGLSIWSLYVAIDWIKDGDGNSWFLLNIIYLTAGSVLLVTVNFEFIMRGLNRILYAFEGLRGISQVSTRAMIGKKSRLSLIFTIFTLLLITNVFIMTASHTMQTGNVESYEIKSQGVDLVINTNVGDSDIAPTISNIDGVEQVYSFRSYFGTFSRLNPTNLSSDIISEASRSRRIVEITPQSIKPNGEWDDSSLPFHVFSTSDQTDYNLDADMNEEAKRELSQRLLDDFLNGKQIDFERDPSEENLDGVTSGTGNMVIGDYYSWGWNDLYFHDKNGDVLTTVMGARMFTMMGEFDMLSGSLLVNSDTADNLSGFETINGPNLFLVKTTAGYFESGEIEDISNQIETELNNLNDPTSLSSQKGFLIGATSRIVHEEVSSAFKEESRFWDFLVVITSFGLIIGAAGIIIIAIRSVAERIREIGMMRAIGFQRTTVVWTVALELFFVTIMGLILGLLNGMIMVESFIETSMGIKTVYPWKTLGLYGSGVFLISVLSGIVPGIRASRIPASEALRYSG